jgi:hypothetical protein
MITMKSLGRKRPTKKPHKEKTKAQKVGENPRQNYFGKGGQRI